MTNTTKVINCATREDAHDNNKKLKKEISMESKTFTRISARRYRIVDAEERLMLNF
jgi:chorismate-pyruvate lyase